MRRFVFLPVVLVAISWTNWASVSASVLYVDPASPVLGNSWTQSFHWLDDDFATGGDTEVLNLSSIVLTQITPSYLLGKGIFEYKAFASNQPGINWTEVAKFGNSTVTTQGAQANKDTVTFETPNITDLVFSLTFMDPWTTPISFYATFVTDSAASTFEYFKVSWKPTSVTGDSGDAKSVGGTWTVLKTTPEIMSTDLLAVPEPASVAIWSLVGLGCLFGRRISLRRKVNRSTRWSNKNRQAILQVIQRGHDLGA